MAGSVRRRYWFWIAFFGIGASVFGMLMIEWSLAFLVPMLVVQMIAGIGLMGLQCGSCGASPLYREKYVFGVKTKAFWPSLPNKCPACAARI
jgi:hypothetical protein